MSKELGLNVELPLPADRSRGTAHHGGAARSSRTDIVARDARERMVRVVETLIKR